MKPKTRQTLIGVTGQVIVMSVGLSEGLNGRMMVAGVIVIGLTAGGHLWDTVDRWFKQ